MFLFTLGISLAIMTHVTLLIYIIFFAALYLIINIKNFISGYKYVPFAISCFIVLMLSATYYIPMLMNFGVVHVSDMGYNMNELYFSLASNYSPSSWMFPTTLMNVVVFVMLCAMFIFKCVKKTVTKNEIGFFILCASIFVITSPHTVYAYKPLLCIGNWIFVVTIKLKNFKNRFNLCTFFRALLLMCDFFNMGFRFGEFSIL